ncbi:hypothetical protein PSHT_11560 [Puccinia striiformis]|uniref:Secreted protein n=1 Tax=Puccinia striiformis TaxID=27350 RepID=A0A2S4V2V9_9BASI|nr:hypothetical protein PSHT_11560 [Puccinia striiformis]
MQFTTLTGLKCVFVILVSPQLFSVCMGAAVAGGQTEAVRHPKRDTKLTTNSMYYPGLPQPDGP